MKGLRLYKKEKLSSPTAIEQLFGRPGVKRPDNPVYRAIAYPWRAVWTVNTRRHADCPQFLISVPKRRVRHAVDRVLQRRRCREAYRLHRDLLPGDVKLDIALVYIGAPGEDYDRTERAVVKLLGKIAAGLATGHDGADAPVND